MKFLPNLILITFLISGCEQAVQEGFEAEWPDDIKRIWVGPDFWANRLQDWQVEDGKLICNFSGVNRNVTLLTRQLNDAPEEFTVSTRFGFNSTHEEQDQWAGLRLGIWGRFDDYRDAAVRGTGINFGVTTDGRLFIDRPGQGIKIEPAEEYLLKVSGNGSEQNYNVRAVLEDQEGNTLGELETDTITARDLEGLIALISHSTMNRATPFSRFTNLTVSGTKVVEKEDQAFGPVLFNQYTLSKGTLKMTAQFAPTGSNDSQTAMLEILENEIWRAVSEVSIDPLARTATFKVQNWESGQDIPYRIVYDVYAGNEKFNTHYYEGTVVKDPVDKEKIVIAAFTGNNDLGFPNTDLFENVKKQNPDFLFFSGDQIYEGVGGYGVQRSPIDKSALDYLRKWYLYGWAYGEIFRDRPVVAIPDDHDVYHGNIWGAGGKATGEGGTQMQQQDRGGYKQPPEWVNMVQRTQTSHLPDPYDPTPVKQGITVYYTDIVYGGISFAVIEDRKFKSAPGPLLPEAQVDNGWGQNPEWDPKTQSDIPEATLLGERQLEFLRHWAEDWNHRAIMKVVLSQTIFSTVATLPAEAMHDRIVPTLRILPPDEYAEGDKPVADMDTNGWPQGGRNKALREIRRAFALHIAGDQHLGSTIQYGIDEFRDAGYAICVPSVSNVWPRRWFPPEPGLNRESGMPKYTGDFEDGFGNKMTVYAVSNPVHTGREPSNLHDRATGYGIIKFNKKTRETEMANWPRDMDPSLPDAQPYDGWPVTIHQYDNYGRGAVAFLPEIQTSGLDLPPVVQVIEASSGNIIYTVRAKESSFQPKVFSSGDYIVRIGEPGTENWKTVETSTGDDELVNVSF